MAKVRVYLKYFNSTLNMLIDDVKQLRGKGANRASEAELAALHQKLTAVQTLMAGECPEAQFRNFEIAETTSPKRPTRKSSRVKARKGA